MAPVTQDQKESNPWEKTPRAPAVARIFRDQKVSKKVEQTMIFGVNGPLLGPLLMLLLVPGLHFRRSFVDLEPQQRR